MPKVQSSTLDLDGAQLQNAVLHNITGSGDWSDTIGGIVGFMSANDDKRIAFWDNQTSALVKVPRLDRAETVTGVWNFSNNFTVGSGVVIPNLNADTLDGYDSSTSATQSTIPVYGTGGILNVATPTASGHAANKGYVDSAVQGLDIKASCRVATTGSIADLSAVTVATIDGITLVEGDRVLVKDTASPDGIEALHAKYNGIYVVGVVSVGVAPLTRADDSDTSAEVTSGMFTFIGEGSVHGSQGWTLTTADPITLDTTALTFEQFSGAGQIIAGTGIDKTGETISLKVGGATTWSQGDIIYADSTTTINGSGALTGILQGNGTNAPTGVSGTQYGLPYFSAAGTVATTAAGTSTQVLHGNSGGAPTWSAVSLTADVSGILPVANGGSGLASWTANGVVYASGTGTLANGSALAWDGSTLTVDGDLTFTGPQTIATSSGALTLAPASGSNLEVTMTGVGYVNITASGADRSLESTSSGLKTGHNYGTVFTNTSTSDTASISKHGIYVNSVGLWDGGSNPNYAIYIAGASGGDTNWAIYNATAADVYLGTGNVGIGTTAPVAKTHIEGTSATYMRQLRMLDTAKGTLDFGAISGAAVISTDSWDLAFNTNSDLGTDGSAAPSNERMRITSAGNVGIGTTTPQSLLHIKGSDSLQFLRLHSVSEALGALSGLSFTVGADYQSKASIALESDYTWGRGDLLFMIDNTADNSEVTVADEVMRIARTGKVGIGTSSPDYLLDVNGTFGATGAVTLANYTTAGGILQTDGSGNVTGPASIPAGTTIGSDAIARKSTFTIGDGAATTYTCTHSWTTRDVQVEVYRVASPYDTIYADVERVSLAAVEIKFRTAPSSDEYQVVITG
jgi:hypothetical protein